jgi:protein-L-isoaspartate O-methyltransferase
MAMNVLHQRRCSSAGWAHMVCDKLLPWALADVELGDHTLEIGPGYGATLRALVDWAGAVTAVEVDKPMAERLQQLYGDRARVLHSDGGDTGLPDKAFSSVVCFTIFITSPPIGCKTGFSPRHFASYGPVGCLPAATACRRCHSG